MVLFAAVLYTALSIFYFAVASCRRDIVYGAMWAVGAALWWLRIVVSPISG